MKTLDTRGPERLNRLLPGVYRIADVDQQEQLRALLSLINGQADLLRDSTAQLWDDFFVETAQRWVIPYIGELVGNVSLHDLDMTSASQTAERLFEDLASRDLRALGAIRIRADVAKTIYYRRRKGTPAMLEELARDVTGWGAHVVEYFQLLRWNQHLEHLRRDAYGSAELRRMEVVTRIGTPWDKSPHTVDVRRINEWDGWYNLSNVGFFLWRLKAFPLTQVRPREIGAGWKLSFDPLGKDAALFASGHRAAGGSPLADELSVHAPIRPAAFYEDLRPVPPATDIGATTSYYGDPAVTDGSLVVFEDVTTPGGATIRAAITAKRVECRNLEEWDALTVRPDDDKVLVDVKRGRLVAGDDVGRNIRVSYFHGFSAPMGGGEYERARWLVPLSATPVLGGDAVLDDQIRTRVLPLAPAAPSIVINISDSETYTLKRKITLADGESLTVQAQNLKRPVLRLDGGSLEVEAGEGSSLTFGGVVIEGALKIVGDLGRLRLLHTTLVPGRWVSNEGDAPSTGPSLVVDPGTSQAPQNTALEVQVAFSILGALRLPSSIKSLTILDSIVLGVAKAGESPSIAIADAADASGPPAHIERSTIFGRSRFLKLDMASETIFTGVVNVTRQQEGCVRFSFVPPESTTPQQYRCQPALERKLVEERTKNAATADAVLGWLVPTFVSERYGDGALAQLRLSAPEQIRMGAEDGSEMGAFCALKQAQREANLRIRLDEYLPVGLEAGLIYVT